MLKNVKIAFVLCVAFFLLCCSGDKPEEALVCGASFYDKQTEFCYYGIVYAKCGKQEYRPEIQICNNDIVLMKCGNEYYNERTDFCYEDAVYPRCNWSMYEPEKEKCVNGIILIKCGNDYYNERSEFCYNNSVQKKCNGAIYDLAKQKCTENDSLLNICKGVPYEPYSQYCVDGKVTDKEVFIDLRDGKEYKTVVIGKQTWMAENLNYGSDDKLYDWETAMEVCPSGWHLPSLEEWQKLLYWVDDEAGKLKSTSGWKCIGNTMVLSMMTSEWADEWGDLISTTSYQGSCWEPGYGSDEFGFSALPGGAVSHKGNTGFAYEYGFWWSSTNKGNTAIILSLAHFSNYIRESEANKLHQLSVRCIKD